MRYSDYNVLAAILTSSVLSSTTQSSTVSLKSVGSTSAKTAGRVAQAVHAVVILMQV